MALIQMNFMSKSLMRTVPVNVILPVDKLRLPGSAVFEGPYQTLYLLHGVFGSYIDWITETRIHKYAEEHDLAVVMPSGDNANYLDHPEGMNLYGNFVGQELVEFTRKIFPLSRERKDTFIGGLSMGGYGAIRNGLKYSETFGSIVALSSALIVEQAPLRTNDTMNPLERRDFAEATLGDLDTILDSDRNPKWLVEKLLGENREIPSIYMACGEQDSLRPANDDFSAFLTERGVRHTYVTAPGNHEWDFWDAYIKEAIEWLPTMKGDLGISSGNVGI